MSDPSPPFAGRELDWLLAPFPVSDFARHHWDRSALHVPGAPGKFAAAYPLESWETCRGFREIEASSIDAQGIDRSVAISADQVHPLFRQGLTLCADVTADPQLSPFLAGLRAQLQAPGWPPFAKLYASSNNRGFALHYDAFHVFVMQIAGSKRWFFSDGPAIPSPLTGAKLGPHRLVVTAEQNAVPVLDDEGKPLTPPDEASLRSVVLEPGHCLYLPPGTWHRAEAIGESIAVSVSPPRASVAELVMQWLQDTLLNRAEWRRDVIPALGEAMPPGRVQASVEKQFAERMRELGTAVANADLRSLHRLWRLNAGGESTAAPPVEPGLKLAPTDVLHHRAPLSWLVAPLPQTGGDALFVFQQASEWVLPLAATKFVQAMVARPIFSLHDAQSFDPSLSPAAVAELLTRFVHDGLLVVDR